MTLNRTLSATLADNGYHIYVDSHSGAEFCFEDDSLLGHVRIYETAEELLNNWSNDEQRFLHAYAPSIRSAGPKSWNIYTVLVARQSADERSEPLLRILPDDLSATRKLYGTGVETENDCMELLLPLLPIQRESQLVRLDVKEELRSQLNLSAAQLDALLTSDNIDNVVDAMIADR